MGPASLSRRDFLRLLGASMALAGAEACGMRQPKEEILPFVRPPLDMVPGRPIQYATTLELRGAAFGVLVRSESGRPTKIEGNPLHPASLGASDIFAQAALLDLYDPARSRTVLRDGGISTWDACLRDLRALGGEAGAREGLRLRVLTGTVVSPTLAAALEDLTRRFPQARIHAQDPMDTGHEREALDLLFARSGNPAGSIRTMARLDKARVVVSLDADFLGCDNRQTRHSHDFAAGRLPESQEALTRLYVAEACPTLTGAAADSRLPVPPQGMEALAWRLAGAVGLPFKGGFPISDPGIGAEAGEPGRAESWIRRASADLLAHRGKALILAGESQPPAVHLLAHALTAFLGGAQGNPEDTLAYCPGGNPAAGLPLGDLRGLVEDMAAGNVDAVLILGANPAYTAPADLDFPAALARVRHSVHAGPYRDETAALCRWHVPAAHALESWGDALAWDGTASPVQPLIEPLYGGRTYLETVAAFQGDAWDSDYEAVRRHWRARFAAQPADGADRSFDAYWNRALAEGVFPGTASALLRPGPEAWTAALERLRRSSATARPGSEAVGAGAGDAAGLTMQFRPDPTVWDGAFSGNAWLQELPKPFSNLVWGNAALLGPGTAAKLGLVDRDEAELSYRGRILKAPIWILPGHAEGAVTLTLGHGRGDGHPVAAGVGYNAYRLRFSDAPWHGRGVRLRRTGGTLPLVSTQAHHSMEGRGLAVAWTAEKYRRETASPHSPGPAAPSLYPDVAYPGYAWGMAIDLSLCTGCSACVAACQAENNIPVVGAEQAALGREMHWIRVDAYFQELPGEAEFAFQPVPCMHCEDAPCELVCPVEATVHDSEGLNAMVYNRCVGTRYCSNNCPYKVRRFNFLQYADLGSESLKAMRNPEVTVRSRGVMEKCTYCVQRIEAARSQAGKENRAIRDGEAVTACAQACPSRAITFGNVNDRDSRVSRAKAGVRNYALLESLNTRPRTTYLARVRGPSPGGA